MNWIDLSDDSKAKAARLNWRSRKLLKNWNYDEEGQSILNRIIEHSTKGKSWKPYMNRPLKPKGRHKTRGGRDQDRWRKRYSTIKIMRERRNLRYRNIEDYCRANGIEFRRFTPDGWCPAISTESDAKALEQAMTEHNT